LLRLLLLLLTGWLLLTVHESLYKRPDKGFVFIESRSQTGRFLVWDFFNSQPTE
jgi:hypothetical protein